MTKNGTRVTLLFGKEPNRVNRFGNPHGGREGLAGISNALQ